MNALHTSPSGARRSQSVDHQTIAVLREENVKEPVVLRLSDMLACKTIMSGTFALWRASLNLVGKGRRRPYLGTVSFIHSADKPEHVADDRLFDALTILARLGERRALRLQGVG